MHLEIILLNENIFKNDILVELKKIRDLGVREKSIEREAKEKLGLLLDVVSTI